jgi:hypothetical protein
MLERHIGQDSIIKQLHNGTLALPEHVNLLLLPQRQVQQALTSACGNCWVCVTHSHSGNACRVVPLPVTYN